MPPEFPLRGAIVGFEVPVTVALLDMWWDIYVRQPLECSPPKIAM